MTTAIRRARKRRNWKTAAAILVVVAALFASLFVGCGSSGAAGHAGDAGGGGDSNVDGGVVVVGPPNLSDGGDGGDGALQAVAFTASPTQVTITPGAQATLTATLASPAVTEVTIGIQGLPIGVTGGSATISPGATAASLTLQASTSAPQVNQSATVLATTATGSGSVPIGVLVTGGACAVDQSFGDAGTIFAPYPDGGPLFQAAIVQQGAVLALDMFDLTSQPHPAHALRYLLDGSIDTAFNGGTPLVINFGTGAEEILSGAFVQADGKYVVYGYSFASGTGRNLIARINTDGSLDTSFGTNGIVVNLPPDQNPSLAAARLFGGAEQPDGRLVFAGQDSSGQGGWFLLRLTTTGASDPTMGDGGVADDLANTNGQPTGLAIQSNGEFVSYGSFRNESSPTDDMEWAAARFSASGAPDTTYATSGKFSRTVGIGQLGAVGIQAGFLDTTDRLTVASGGATDAGAFFAAARLDTTGALDFTFNSAQIVSVPLGNGVSNLTVLLRQADDKLVLAGSSPLGSLTVVRLNGNGTLDTTCGQSGVSALDSGIGVTFGTVTYAFLAAAFDAQGRLVIAGQGTNAGAPGMWITRVWL